MVIESGPEGSEIVALTSKGGDRLVRAALRRDRGNIGCRRGFILGGHGSLRYELKGIVPGSRWNEIPPGNIRSFALLAR